MNMKVAFWDLLFNPRRRYGAVGLQQGKALLNSDANTKDRLCGIYRGIVSNNIDPDNLMRLQVKLPDVLGTEAALFAQPCLPATNSQVSLPPIGAIVWVMFEKGDPNLPVWVGNFRPPDTG
jgi:hypothetical protein